MLMIRIRRKIRWLSWNLKLIEIGIKTAKILSELSFTKDKLIKMKNSTLILIISKVTKPLFKKNKPKLLPSKNLFRKMMTKTSIHLKKLK